MTGLNQRRSNSLQRRSISAQIRLLRKILAMCHLTLYRSLALATLFSCVLMAGTADAQTPWNQSAAKAFQDAQTTGRPVVVFVGTNWCHFCELMQNKTWSDPTIDQTVQRNFITLKLDGDRDQAIVQELGLQGYPATIVYTPGGQRIAKKEGFMPPAETQQWLAQANQRWKVARSSTTAASKR